jgi:hypothetical protein
MRKNLLIVILSVLLASFATSAKAQTLVTDGFYGGGEDENRTQVNVDGGVLTFIQSCYAGETMDAMEVDVYGAFNTPGEFGSRPHIGFGRCSLVDLAALQ